MSSYNAHRAASPRWLWAVLIGFTALHFIAIPLLITFDGFLYLDQARMLFTPRFWTDWHFLRTPLFQCLTRTGFAVAGESPGLLMFITASLGFIGLAVLYRIACYWLDPFGAALCTILVAVNPLLVTYQHTFLTETGSFAFIAVITLQVLAILRANCAVRKTLLFGLLLSVAYYFRPTLLILAIPGYACVALFARGEARWRIRLLSFLTMIALPVAASYPWRAISTGQNWKDAQVMFGLVNQAVFAPDSPLLGAAQPQYVVAMERSARNGHLTSSGIADGETYPIIGMLESQPHPEATRYFLEIISTYPMRYLKGVVRGALLLGGLPGIDSDNEIFINKALESESNFIFTGPEGLQSWVESNFSGHAGRGYFRSIMQALVTPYAWLYRLGILLLCLALPYSLIARSPYLFALSIIPLTFLMFHAITLFSLDRMMVPITPIACAFPLIAVLHTVFKPRLIS